MMQLNARNCRNDPCASSEVGFDSFLSKLSESNRIILQVWNRMNRELVDEIIMLTYYRIDFE